MTRFGPGPVIWGASLVGLGLVLAFLLTGRAHWVLPGIGLAIVLLALPGWNWYRLDASGIHRRGVRGTKHVPWDVVDAVINRSGVRMKQGDEVVTQFVVDARDRPLLRLDAWVANRGHLVRLILATIHARRLERRRGVPSPRAPTPRPTA